MSFSFLRITAYKHSTGVTNQLERRLHEHRTKLNPQSYPARYDITYLVYFERQVYAGAAWRREKEIKRMSRWEREQLIRQLETEEHGSPRAPEKSFCASESA
jgi:putative endonuclease